MEIEPTINIPPVILEHDIVSWSRDDRVGYNAVVIKMLLGLNTDRPHGILASEIKKVMAGYPRGIVDAAIRKLLRSRDIRGIVHGNRIHYHPNGSLVDVELGSDLHVSKAWYRFKLVANSRDRVVKEFPARSFGDDPAGAIIILAGDLDGLIHHLEAARDSINGHDPARRL